MRIPRLYIPQALRLEESLVLDTPLSHHVGTVLRLRKGHTLCFFNGGPYEYFGIITAQSSKKITVQIQERLAKNQACPLAIHLGQSLVKGHKMDFVMQKATELGVHAITPLLTERCMALDSERLEKKQAHWQKIVIHAAEQCGRTEIPTLQAAIGLTTWMDQRRENTRLLLDPQADQGIEQKIIADSAVLLIGPEGGLSPLEKDYAMQKGFKGLQLGPRVLRTETAALAALVALQCRAGDFRL
jgi:16S rRNA (uracil1498-N3)-methyltransferase